MKKILRTIGWILLILILTFVGFVAYITITDYKPDKVEVIVERNSIKNINELQQDTFSFID